MEYSRIAKIRRRTLARHFDIGKLAVLEIGPLDNPTVQKEDGDVSCLDWFSKAELTARAIESKHRTPERIVAVDFVIKDREISRFIPRKFDLFIANHVLEHIPDIIFWMDQLRRISCDNAHVFLSLPDKRYTFDAARTSTNAVDVFRNHRLGLVNASFWDVLSQRFYEQWVDPAKVWAGEMLDLSKRRRSFAEAVELAEAQAREYSSAHVSVFESGQFEIIWKDLFQARLVQWDLVKVYPPEPSFNEFYAVLRLDASAEPSTLVNLME